MGYPRFEKVFKQISHANVSEMWPRSGRELMSRADTEVAIGER